MDPGRAGHCQAVSPMRRGQGLCARLARLPPHVPAAHILSQWHPRQRRAAPWTDCVPSSPVLIRQLLPRAGAGQARAVEARPQPWAVTAGSARAGTACLPLRPLASVLTETTVHVRVGLCRLRVPDTGCSWVSRYVTPFAAFGAPGRAHCILDEECQKDLVL